MSLNGWHVGERSIHSKLHHTGNHQIDTLYLRIAGDLDPDHAIFHSTKLPFIPVTTLDEEGRPWVSILASEDGKTGEQEDAESRWIQNVKYTKLDIRTRIWEGDPLKGNSKLFGGGRCSANGDEDGKMLIAGIGVEFSTRRRNKFAGWISKLRTKDENVFDMELTVNQSLGNCPKYIISRQFIPHPRTHPTILHENHHLEETDKLPDDIISFIHSSDTVFIGTTYHASSEDAKLYPSHVGTNIRGGRKGFIRVSLKDMRTVVLPDYSGNRFMTSLGNIEATPFASLTIVSFTTGDILYLTGKAKNYVGPDAKILMPFHSNEIVTTIHTTGYIFVSNALPVRLAPGTKEEQSPYSPPVRYLSEELEIMNQNGTGTKFVGSGGEHTVSALLKRIVLHSPTVATYTWEISTPDPKQHLDLMINPGQAMILNFSPLLGEKQYAHMAPSKPSSVNDDRIRTWTVSDCDSFNYQDDPKKDTFTFSLTMREKPGGLVTGALFSIAHGLARARPEMMGVNGDLKILGIQAGIVGISGGFGSVLDGNTKKKMLWIAGGIGLTPFLSMLRALRASKARSGGSGGSGREEPLDIKMILAARDAEVLISLVEDALGDGESDENDMFKFEMDVFRGDCKEIDMDKGDAQKFSIRTHTGRLPEQFFSESKYNADVLDLKERDVYLCASPEFEKTVLDDLGNAGFDIGLVKKEGFAY